MDQVGELVLAMRHAPVLPVRLTAIASVSEFMGAAGIICDRCQKE